MASQSSSDTTLAPRDMTEDPVQYMLEVEDVLEVEEGVGHVLEEGFRSSKRLRIGVTLGEQILYIAVAK